MWIVDEDHKHHYQECQICHEKLMDTYDVHHYDPYGDDWQCSVCGQIHGFDCDGTLVPDAAQSTCKHLVGYCSDCGLLLEKFGALGEFADYHTFSEGVCTTCGAIDQTYTPPTDPDPTPDPNPVGSAGTTMLPNSQLDRFLIRVSMGYPDHKSSVNILRDRHVDNPLDRAYAVVNKEELLGLVQDVRKVDMRDAVLDYVTTLVEKTRTHPQVALGVSPRGALAVCRMAKAYAYLNGRDFVMPEDVAAIFPDVCAHRLMLNSKARMMEEKPESVLAEILKTTDMPVLKK